MKPFLDLSGRRARNTAFE